MHRWELDAFSTINISTCLYFLSSFETYYLNQVFTHEGTYVQQFGRNQLSSPNYVAVSEDNRVLVSDTNNNRIKIFNAQGCSLSTFGSVGTGKCIKEGCQICIRDKRAQLCSERVLRVRVQ